MEEVELSDDPWPFLLEVLESALEMRPELAGMATEDGTMLHTACKRGASTHVIRALLNACPEAARTRNKKGKLPLHYACRAENVSLEVVGMLLDHYPEALCLTSPTERAPGDPNKRICEARTRERTPILTELCWGDDLGQFEESKTELVLLLLERCPESASIMCDGKLPLHHACESHAPSVIIQRLVEACPQGVRERSFYGMDTGDLPLHYYACGSEATLEVVRLLMAQYPESIRVRQAHTDSLPIHLACQSRDTPLDVSRLLFNSYQDGARIKDELGCLPLHYASQCGALEIGRLLLEHYPSGARVQNWLGCLPLHLSCNGSSFCEDAIDAKAELTRAMLRCYPDGIRTADYLGQLPLHRACGGCKGDYSCPMDSSVRWGTPFLRYLIELYPDAIRHADRDGHLPLHVSIVMHRGLDHIRLLIEYDLNTVLCKTSEGATPLQLLCQRQNGRPPDPEIRAFLIEKQDEALRALREAVKAATEEQLLRLLPKSSFDLVIAKIWELAQPTLWEPPN